MNNKERINRMKLHIQDIIPLYEELINSGITDENDIRIPERCQEIMDNFLINEGIINSSGDIVDSQAMKYYILTMKSLFRICVNSFNKKESTEIMIKRILLLVDIAGSGMVNLN